MEIYSHVCVTRRRDKPGKSLSNHLCAAIFAVRIKLVVFSEATSLNLKHRSRDPKANPENSNGLVPVATGISSGHKKRPSPLETLMTFTDMVRC